MRNITSEMRQYLQDNKSTTLAYFMTIVTKDGVKIRVNDTNEDFVLSKDLLTEEEGKFKYYSCGYIPTEFSYSDDNSVPKLDISGLVKENIFDYQLVINNYYEGAEVFISICNYENFDLGQIKIARGNLGNFDINDTGSFTCEVRGFSQKLNNPISTLYSRNCRNTLFDDVCALNQQDYTELGTVSETVNSLTIRVNTLNNSTDYYKSGTMTITSGKAINQKYNIRRVISNNNYYEIELIKQLSVRPENGDSFNIRPGCDKNINTCLAKFNNVDNFNGEPYIPSKNVFNVMGNGQDSQIGKNPLLKV